MEYYLYGNNKIEKNDDYKKVHSAKFCNTCNSQISGIWKYSPVYLYIHRSFVDKNNRMRREGLPPFTFDNFVQAKEDAEVIDLFAEVLGIEKNLKFDIFDEDDVKKALSFALMKKINFEESYLYDDDDDPEYKEEMNLIYGDKSQYTQKYFKELFTETPVKSKLGNYIDYYLYLDNDEFKTYKDFFDSDEYKELLKIKSEMQSLSKLQKCPICGSNLSFSKETNEKRFSKAATASKTFVSKILNDNTSSMSRAGSIDISNVDSLKEYIKTLFDVEILILDVSKRLENVYAQRELAKDDLNAIVAVNEFKNNQKYNQLKQEYDNAINTEFSPKIKISDIPVELPEKPVEPKAPEKPVLKKAGLFNKKKVLSENNLLEEKYAKTLEQYEEDVKIYDSKMITYRNEVELLKNKQKEQFESAVQKEKEEYLKKIEILKEKLDNESYNIKENNEMGKKFPEKIKYDLIDRETNEAIVILKKAVTLRSDLYSFNIVFEKYRDVVSIATFYEYLSSGRCQELAGADGAYNLYENEIRMNTVISQLSRVIESLEQIKDNQFTIYSALQKMNNQLSTLNNTLDKALLSISKIEKATTNIEQNSKIIAYNTERTAYYAKKNAELTNALGYMVALS